MMRAEYDLGKRDGKIQLVAWNFDKSRGKLIPFC